MSQGRNFGKTWGCDLRVMKAPHTCVVREDFLLRGHEGCKDPETSECRRQRESCW